MKSDIYFGYVILLICSHLVAFSKINKKSILQELIINALAMSIKKKALVELDFCAVL